MNLRVIAYIFERIGTHSYSNICDLHIYACFHCLWYTFSRIRCHKVPKYYLIGKTLSSFNLNRPLVILIL